MNRFDDNWFDKDFTAVGGASRRVGERPRPEVAHDASGFKLVERSVLLV